MSKNNVHPDHYKTAGRDRQDDAAAARQARSIATGRMKQGTAKAKRPPARPPAPSKRNKARPSSGGR